MTSAEKDARLVAIVRWLLGIEFTINGLNWWVKLITPYPSMSDGTGFFPPGDFVAAMIQTGIVFHLVKAMELLAGVALLANRFVPLALVAVFSITINVFIADVFLGHKLRSYLMGSGALLMNSYLLFAYLGHYRALLLVHGRPAVLNVEVPPPAPAIAQTLRGITRVLGMCSALIGAVMVSWVGVMIVQHFLGHGN